MRVMNLTPGPRAPIVRRHACPVPGCDAQLAVSQPMCSQHLDMLPRELQHAMVSPMPEVVGLALQWLKAKGEGRAAECR